MAEQKITEQNMKYEELLEEAFKNIKPIESKIERFEVPSVEGHIEGNKTIITNFKQICNYIRRDPNHVLKFLLKGLATSGVMRGDRLILMRKVPSRTINEKIKSYVDEFVICKECKKPDTELIKQDNFVFIHCLACGAKRSSAKI